MADPANSPSAFPGFEFLQTLMQNAGAVLPTGIGQWAAPTLDTADLDKRIGELRTVQFWLEQNARMLATTIQALEVQRMTLQALKSMNVQMSDLQRAMSFGPPPPATPRAAAEEDEAPAEAPPEAEPTAAPPSPPPGIVDPVQWWTGLTQQFAQLAGAVAQEGAVPPAGGTARKAPAAKKAATGSAAAASGGGKTGKSQAPRGGRA